MLRAASIGLGWWSDELASSIQGKSGTIKITACSSRSAEKRSAFARKFGAQPYETYEAVLADPAIDAVILTTPHSLHAAHVTQAAKAGKHVFVEKPFDVSAVAAKAAAEACKKAGVVLAVGHNRRFAPAALAIRKMVAEGSLGQILHAEAQFSNPSALSYTPDRWRASRIESPGGGIAGMGVHMIDLLQWMLGPIERVRSIAKRQAVKVDIDDTTSALFEFASGQTAYLGTLTACPRQGYFYLYGTAANAYARVDDHELMLQRANAAKPEPIALTPVDTLHAELEAFAQACAGGPEFPVPPRDAIHTVAVMEAMVASAAKDGAPVKPAL
jgi:predicted dehydrogenase